MFKVTKILPACISHLIFSCTSFCTVFVICHGCLHVANHDHKMIHVSKFLYSLLIFLEMPSHKCITDSLLHLIWVLCLTIIFSFRSVPKNKIKFDNFPNLTELDIDICSSILYFSGKTVKLFLSHTGQNIDITMALTFFI